MSVVVVGVSHKTAPIELREKLAVPADRLTAALNQLQSLGTLKEAVVLSTCNRMEIYARPLEDASSTLTQLRKFFYGLYNSPALEKALYEFHSEEAVAHLFRVAAGLDSLVVGESEVLGQVKAAYVNAQKNNMTGKITNVLFQRALFVGKAVRSQTAISEGSSSVGSVAVRLAERIFGDLRDRRVLLIGAGKIAEVTARHLLSQKTGQLVVLNRTLTKAEELARQLNGSAQSLDQLPDELLKADIVVCSTASETPLITRAMVEPIMKARRMRSLYFIDISVPRNVDPLVHNQDNVYVYNIDDLKSLVEESMQHRKSEINSADSLVKQMAADFAEWLRAALEGKERPLRHKTDPSL